jgi:hypothetical protein
MRHLPADSLPITKVIFCWESIAERRALRAWERKPRKEFLGAAILVVAVGRLRIPGYCSGCIRNTDVHRLKLGPCGVARGCAKLGIP